MRKKNIALRNAIFEKGITQRSISRKVKIPEALLSMAINGKFNLNDEQQKKIAKILGRNVNELFN